MSSVLERYREQLKRERARWQTEIFQNEARELLDQQNQAIASIRDDTTRIAEDISTISAVADWALPELVRQVATTSNQLVDIHRLLASPSETAAEEYFRRGVRALASEWTEEAIDDLTKAVEQYPYRAQAWFSLAIAHYRQGNEPESAKAFARAARYSARDDVKLSAAAILIGAAIHRGLGDDEASRRLLESSLPNLASCPWIHLALAVHHGDSEHLFEALHVLPDLTEHAVAAKAPNLAESCRRIRSEDTGPFVAYEELRLAHAQLRQSAGRLLGGSSPEEIDRPSQDDVQGLMDVARRLPEARQQATALLQLVKQRVGALAAKTAMSREKLRMAVESTSRVDEDAHAAAKKQAEAEFGDYQRPFYELMSEQSKLASKYNEERLKHLLQGATASVKLAEWRVNTYDKNLSGDMYFGPPALIASWQAMPDHLRDVLWQCTSKREFEEFKRLRQAALPPERAEYGHTQAQLDSAKLTLDRVNAEMDELRSIQRSFEGIRRRLNDKEQELERRTRQLQIEVREKLRVAVKADVNQAKSEVESDSESEVYWKKEVAEQMARLASALEDSQPIPVVVPFSVPGLLPELS